MQTTTIKPVEELTTADRIKGLLKSILQDNNIIPKAFHGLIVNHVDNYLQNADEAELKKHIEYLRDEVIPFILGT